MIGVLKRERKPLCGRDKKPLCGRYNSGREKFDGWPLPGAARRSGEESPGSTGQAMPVNGRARRLDGKCHRNIPPDANRVRAKWCGKSAPGVWRQMRRVNPIGSKAKWAWVLSCPQSGGRLVFGRFLCPPRQERPHEGAGNGVPREMATQTQNPAYRRAFPFQLIGHTPSTGEFENDFYPSK